MRAKREHYHSPKDISREEYLSPGSPLCAGCGGLTTLRLMHKALGGNVVVVGDFDEAEVVYREASRIYDVNPDFVGPQPAGLAKNLGELLCRQEERRAEAVELYRQAQAKARETVGAEHWLTGTIDSSFGACLASLGDRQAGEPLLRGGLELLRGTLGDDHLQTRKAAERLRELEDGP